MEVAEEQVQMKPEWVLYGKTNCLQYYYTYFLDWTMQGGSLHLALSYICLLLKLQIQNKLSFQNLKKH